MSDLTTLQLDRKHNRIFEVVKVRIVEGITDNSPAADYDPACYAIVNTMFELGYTWEDMPAAVEALEYRVKTLIDLHRLQNKS